MEVFKKIDWHPSLDDLIDDVFIHDERMERESAMYRIMNGTFTDPLEGIESEYAEVNLDLIKQYLREDGDDTSIEEEDDDEDEEDREDEKRKQQVPKRETKGKAQEQRAYVPGIRKIPFFFPKKSCLNKAEQAMCLRVLLKFSNDDKKGLSTKERSEFEQYMTLQKSISEEQKEYLEFVKSKWDDTFNWSIKSNKYVAIKWRAKMKKFMDLPNYYAKCTNVPLTVQKIDVTAKVIKVEFVSCLRQGSLPKVTLPKLERPCMLNMDPNALLADYPPCAKPDKVTQHFRLPVSEDTYCESLAIEAKVDLVISSSGLKCLLNNVDPDYANSWIAPVVIKSHNDKNVIYIDKRVPPSVATVPQKNTWVYKYILRHYCVNIEDESSDGTEETNEDKSERPDPIGPNADSTGFDDLCNDHLRMYEEDLCLPDEKESGRSNRQQQPAYNVFAIGPVESQSHEQMKHNAKEYHMLVRTKTDGVEMLANGESQPLTLAVKMEHQLAFGAEAITLEEGLHQWASLKFRPETLLARARVATDTAELIQIERLTTTSLSSEIKRLHNIKVEDSLSVLHNMIEGLSSLAPGRYIMRHVPQDGPFAFVYKHVEEYRKDVFDLHEICQPKIFQTITKTPWIPIDNMTTTPAIRCFQKMPAMFHAHFACQKPSTSKTSKMPKGKKVAKVNQQGP